MSSILIIYGSSGGNTKLVVDKVSKILQESHQVEVQIAENSNIEDAKNHDLCILAAPTYGHGILQPYMAPVHQKLINSDFKDQKFAVIGLGDHKYDRPFNIASARILKDGIAKAGGELINEALLINKSPIPHLDTKVKDWAQELSKLI